MIRIYAALALVFLTNCTTDTERSSLDMARNYFAPEGYVPPVRFTALIDDSRPVLDIEFIDLGVAGKLILEHRDGPYARYLSADLGGVVLQNGMLHSVYGFGEPFIGAELSQPLSLVLSAREGRADRFHTYISREDRAVTRTYRCEVVLQGSRDVELTTGNVATTLMSETCINLADSFENLYWVDRQAREIIQSRQWVGGNIGSMVTRVTR